MGIPKYTEGKEKLIGDLEVCPENRQLFKEFLEFEEYKLKRKNGLREIDAGSTVTLYGYVIMLRNINAWFGNKPLAGITEADIKRVYDGLEDGKILNRNGKPFKDKLSYYNKVFKSETFRMIGKDGLAKNVMRYGSTTAKQDVRFIPEDQFRKLVSVIVRPEHRLLAWLQFDYGENINALLKLRKGDFSPQFNNDTKQKEYYLNLRRAILKRARKDRTEINNYDETTELLDIVIQRGKRCSACNAYGKRRLRTKGGWIKKDVKGVAVKENCTGCDGKKF